MLAEEQQLWEYMTLPLLDYGGLNYMRFSEVSYFNRAIIR